MATYTYALLDRRDAEACLAQARDALAQWESGWCADSGIEISCAEADMAAVPADARWRAHRLADGKALWCCRSAGFDGEVERRLFGLDSRSAGERRASELTSGMGAEAVDDLATELLRRFAPNAVEIGGEAPPAWQFRRSGGAAFLRLHAGDKSFGLLLPHGLLPRRDKPVRVVERTPLAALASALGATEGRLHAELDGVDVALGQLASLAPGDVITLEHRLDQPLKVYTANARRVALGHLGRQDGHRALQLFATE